METKGLALWFVAIMAVLYFVWLFSGGPNDERSRSGILLSPPPPLDTGEVYGPTAIIPKLGLSGYPSRSSRDANISATPIVSTDDAPEHSLTLALKATSTRNEMTISGWKLVNARGMVATIPNGVTKFIQGKIETSSPIILKGKDSAVIIGASSPVGVSFRLHRCIGYLSEFQNFNLPLPQSCPGASEYTQRTGQKTPDASCASYLENLPSCRLGQGRGYESLPSSCQNYVANTMNEASCVATFGKDYDFSLPEWRVYLGNTDFLDALHDTIYVYDEKDAPVGSVSW